MTKQIAVRAVPPMYLKGYGRLSWSDARELTDGLKCAWADYQGFHVDQLCPHEAPPYSHLWAWSEDFSRLVRVRIDEDEGIVGILSTAYADGATPVDVVQSTGIPWGHDGQLGQRLPQHIAEGIFHLFEPLVPLPATFVGRAPAS